MKAAASASKIVIRSELVKKCVEWRANGDTIAFTNGIFDLLHQGHIYSLEAAARTADRLVVGVNSDSSARMMNKGSDRPVRNEGDRAASIAAMEVVDLVVIFDEATPYELLADLKPDVLAKGDDYKMEEVVGREFAGRVELIKRLEGFSTSSLVEKIRRNKEH